MAVEMPSVTHTLVETAEKVVTQMDLPAQLATLPVTGLVVVVAEELKPQVALAVRDIHHMREMELWELVEQETLATAPGEVAVAAVAVVTTAAAVVAEDMAVPEVEAAEVRHTSELSETPIQPTAQDQAKVKSSSATKSLF